MEPPIGAPLPLWLRGALKTRYPDLTQRERELCTFIFRELMRLEVIEVEPNEAEPQTPFLANIGEALDYWTFSKKYLEELIKQCEGNLTRAAQVSGLSRATIYRRIKYYRLLVPRGPR